MATSVDMSLDDIIKKNREGGRANRGRGRGRGGPVRPFNAGRMPGAVRRGPLSVNARPSQFTIAKPPRSVRNLPWQHDLLEDSIRAAGITGVEVGTKLYVSNLDSGVTNEDIRELFAEIGDLKRYAVHYEKTGRPSGSAEVVYTRRSDAFSALKKYNNVLLDGKPMKIEIVGANAGMPVSARVNVTGLNGRRKRTVVMTSGPVRARGPAAMIRGAGRGGGGGLRNGRGGGGLRNGRGGGGGGGLRNGRGGGAGGGLRNGRGGAGGGHLRNAQGGGRGRGRGQGKKQPIEKSADQLDKELESYHAEAMQT